MKTQSLALLRALTALAALGFASLLNAQTVTLVATVASLQDAFVSAYSTDGVVLLAGDSATIVSQHAEDSPGSGAAAVQIGSVEFNPAPLLFGMVSRSMVFNGVLVQGGVTKVSLSNPTTNETKWVEVGKSYGGYTVGYEPGQPATKQTPATKDTVLLTLGGKVQRITLQDAKLNIPVVATALEQSHAEIAQRAALTSLNDILASVGIDPNTDPRLTFALQTGIQQLQQSLTTGSAAGESFWLIPPSAELNLPYYCLSTVINPDGGITYINYDSNGRVCQIVHNPALKANNPRIVSELYNAPKPDALATPPAAAK